MRKFAVQRLAIVTNALGSGVGCVWIRVSFGPVDGWNLGTTFDDFVHRWCTLFGANRRVARSSYILTYAKRYSILPVFTSAALTRSTSRAAGTVVRVSASERDSYSLLALCERASEFWHHFDEGTCETTPILTTTAFGFGWLLQRILEEG